MKTTKEKPKCPHCGEVMDIWATDMFNFAGGLGWGTSYLFVCFNDDCPLYVEGWETMMRLYGHKASFRCMCDPTTKKFEGIPVFSPMGMKGGIVDYPPEIKKPKRHPIKVRRCKRSERCKTCDYVGSDIYIVTFHFGMRYTELLLCPDCVDMLSKKIKKERRK